MPLKFQPVLLRSEFLRTPDGGPFEGIVGAISLMTVNGSIASLWPYRPTSAFRPTAVITSLGQPPNARPAPTP
jgi:hypothetical protein